MSAAPATAAAIRLPDHRVRLRCDDSGPAGFDPEATMSEDLWGRGWLIECTDPEDRVVRCDGVEFRNRSSAVDRDEGAGRRGDLKVAAEDGTAGPGLDFLEQHRFWMPVPNDGMSAG
jgi:hypothetical protein